MEAVPREGEESAEAVSEGSLQNLQELYAQVERWQKDSVSEHKQMVRPAFAKVKDE